MKLMRAGENMYFPENKWATKFRKLTDAWHALRTRGEEPVAGIAEEVGT
jgi:hypothetical protein